MNERINILAEQAGFYVSESRREILAPDSTNNVTEALREFAELIVQECAAEADKQTIYCRGIPWGRWIKEHFGVK
jgi:hypothetical protein